MGKIGAGGRPSKRTPRLGARATGRAGFDISRAANGYHTAATQWLERTLDDAANRRLSLPESFLALDGALDAIGRVTRGLVVYPVAIRAHVMEELPFLVTEDILMAATRNGADRQEAHELIRRHSQEAARLIKVEGKPNDLLDRLRAEAMFKDVDFDALEDPEKQIGVAPEQVDRFVATVVQPIRERY